MFDGWVPTRPGTEDVASAVRACRSHLVGAALFSAFVNLLYLTPTLYMLQVYDRVVPTGGYMTLALVSGVALLALATLAGLDWLRTRLLIRAALELDHRLAPGLFARLMAHKGRPQGAQALRDFDQVRGALSGQGALAIMDAPWTPLYLGCCFLLHPAIGVLTLVGGLVLFGLAWANERDTRTRLTEASDAAVGAYALQEALVSQSELVRALGMRKSSIAVQVDRRRTAIDRQVDAQFTGGRYSGLIKFVRLTLQSAALGLAAFLVIRGQMSAGAIIASSVLLSRAVSPIEQLVGAWPGLVQARNSWRSLITLFAETPDPSRLRMELPAPLGRLAVEGVRVQLPGTNAPTVGPVSFVLEPGQSLGIIGQSGSGKTTLARALAGALEPTHGTLRLDGAEYQARDGDELARHIGYLPQSPTLFPGSIRDNISRLATAGGADPSSVDRAVIAAAMTAGVHDLIQRLPNGYDTVLGSGGVGLSAGQAQRLAFARALYGDPVLMVLDEPNASLDQEGETALMNGVTAALARGAAVVIVSHRMGILANVDRLLALRGGAVQLLGPREEVLAKLSGAAPRGQSSSLRSVPAQ
ncbi:type I secretion system permease/ATPase [Brevundimonas sp. LM2]|uniref:type I secretion system permease/ATPase n=1 Tax=Brevundimonas sp. LM2 TaxID=1938605 RepID=UPI000983C10D|nr:type I secretion system permease/ATPase [Brevundimonas sp. LM2]AQR61206.1 type I secretion system permease/ATPase [Brevundimonas sp. LM2]